MSLFDATGVILIAVDDKFTLEDKDGIEANRKSIHGQFLNLYFTDKSGYKESIADIVAGRGEATEVSITIDDKIFVLFAYSTQGNRENYPDDTAYRFGFEEIVGSLKKVFAYCKKHFPNEVVHTALIGTGTQTNRGGNIGNAISEAESEKRIKNVAESVGLNFEIINESWHL